MTCDALPLTNCIAICVLCLSAAGCVGWVAYLMMKD